MAERNALVDGVKGLSAPSVASMKEEGVPAAPKVAVSFQGGSDGYLDMGKPRSTVWAEVLESLSEENQPAYVEIDPSSHEITELLIPIEVTIGNISSPDGEGDIEIELIISHARHVLRKKNPEFDELLSIIQEAQQKELPVIISENDNHEIIDVRMKSESAEGGL
ncbi:hypothetical protein [Desulfogranum marinum]|uniref:hypothetical protein n=1 Tax=Desulfogranum marinum TaxID=453220 RepID=UPI00196451D3|nr:hypothetical protein [Desulfogranum marinum]MBM9513948.1 hypothetical protein [Desulfogranum marinum]